MPPLFLSFLKTIITKLREKYFKRDNISRMERYIPSYDNMEEDDFIDMDISCREFEFQMSLNPIERKSTSSPADELFYKGKLLPLHLPPRLRMVQNLLESTTNSPETDTNALEPTLPPFESFNISTASSCHVSQEQHMPEPRKSWSKKFNLVRQSSLCLKLKASRAYLKSLFTIKSGCFDHLKADKNLSAQSKKETRLIQDSKATSLTKSIKREKMLIEECAYRKSFSGAINCNLITRSSPAMSSRSSSSSFSSASSNGLYGLQALNRSSIVNSGMESSIQGAIAYCKESQVSSRNSVSDVELCSLSATRIVVVCDNPQRTRLCTGRSD